MGLIPHSYFMLVKLLKKYGLTNKRVDFVMINLENTNPFKKNVVRVYSKIKRRNYIIKKCTPNEIKNIYLASKLIIKYRISHFIILKPIGNLGGYYIFDDIGVPLNVGHQSTKLLFNAIKEITDFFLKRGYFWRGTALRNIFYVSGFYMLIDFEKFYKINKKEIDGNHLLFFRLNLLQSFPVLMVNEYIETLKKKYIFSNVHRRMDRVERIAWGNSSIATKEDFFEYFDQLTIDTERPIPDVSIRPFEISHILDEIVIAEISYLITMLLYRQMKKKGYNILLNYLMEIIKRKENRNQVKYEIACVIASGGNYKRLRVLKSVLQDITTKNRTSSYDELLRIISQSVCDLIGVDFSRLFIIARGSYGENILTNESDIDFEIVTFSKEGIDSKRSIENLILRLLAYLDIDSEASSARPIEDDVIIGKDSRDLFEIFQLRLVSGDQDRFMLYVDNFKDKVYSDRLWMEKSQYELTKRALNSKNIFEEIRFLVDRLVMMNIGYIASPSFEEKIQQIPKEYISAIRLLINNVLLIRNKNTKLVDGTVMVGLLKNIHKICDKCDLPKNYLIYE